MGTDSVTRARIAALTAAEAAIEQNGRDPFAELARTSADAAQAIKADPGTVYRIADEIVVRTFRAKLDKPGSLEFLCVSCGADIPSNLLAGSRCRPELQSDDQP